MHGTCVSDLESFCFLQVVKFASKEDRSTPAVTDVDIGIVGYVCMRKRVYSIPSWCWMCCRTTDQASVSCQLH